MDEQISKKAALVAVKDALIAWSYMPEWRDEKILEAIAELPSALGTNLAEVGTDAISRQAAIDLLKQMRKDGDMIPWEGKDVFARIRKLPPAQPERIKGHWIDAVIPNDSGGFPVIVCDKCNTFFPLQFGDAHNFCPNCGADMRGGNDGRFDQQTGGD